MPQLTLLCAGGCALLQCVLTVIVISRRAATGINLLDGGDAELTRRIRAHGNFTEAAPMALLLILLLELSGVAAIWLIALGGCLVLGRVLHAVTILHDGPRWQRALAMILAITVLSFGGAGCLWIGLRSL